MSTASKNKKNVRHPNPYFPGPFGTPTEELREYEKICPGDVVWLHKNTLDSKENKSFHLPAEIQTPQRLCSSDYASAAFKDFFKGHGKSNSNFTYLFNEDYEGNDLRRKENSARFSVTLNDLLGEFTQIVLSFPWIPDGVVLSTTDSDLSGGHNLTGPYTLLNIAVQGPAIARCWSGDTTLKTAAGDSLYLVFSVEIKAEFSSNDDDETEVKLSFDKDSACILHATSRTLSKIGFQIKSNDKKLEQNLMMDLNKQNFNLKLNRLLSYKIGTVLDSAASKIGGVISQKRGRSPVAVNCNVSINFSLFNILKG